MIIAEQKLGRGLATCLSMYMEPDNRTILTELIEDYCEQVAGIGKYPKAFVFEKVLRTTDASARIFLDIVFQNDCSPENNGSSFNISCEWMKLAPKHLDLCTYETGYQDPRMLRYALIKHPLALKENIQIKQLWEGSLI